MQAISDAVADVAPQVRKAMAQHPGFADVGQRMLLAWAEGVQGLRDERVYRMGVAELGVGFEALERPPKLRAPKVKVGLSPLLGKRWGQPGLCGWRAISIP